MRSLAVGMQTSRLSLEEWDVHWPWLEVFYQQPEVTYQDIVLADLRSTIAEVQRVALMEGFGAVKLTREKVRVFRDEDGPDHRVKS